MKNITAIIIGFCAVLCAIGCILLIVVILRTDESHQNPFTTILHSISRLRGQPAGETDIRIPERFQDLPDATDSLPQPEPDSLSEVSPPQDQPEESRFPAPVYIGSYHCNEMINALQMKEILSENNLYCKMSKWSETWANAKGKGIREHITGLSFGDSTVVDTLTNIMWQRFATAQQLTYTKADSACAYLNEIRWQGFDNWRLPTIEELMGLMVPKRNRAGLHLPGRWDCKAHDLWSCNTACDSLSVKWIWVGRLALGRCNYGHPAIERSVLAVRQCNE